MKLERVVTTPDNYAPFLLSQGIKFGNLLFISGQAGAGEGGKILEGNFRAQGKQAFANLRRALAISVVDLTVLVSSPFSVVVLLVAVLAVVGPPVLRKIRAREAVPA